MSKTNATKIIAETGDVISRALASGRSPEEIALELHNTGHLISSGIHLGGQTWDTAETDNEPDAKIEVDGFLSLHLLKKDGSAAFVAVMAMALAELVSDLDSDNGAMFPRGVRLKATCDPEPTWQGYRVTATALPADYDG